jgi:hypothetical protein
MIRGSVVMLVIFALGKATGSQFVAKIAGLFKAPKRKIFGLVKW